MAQALDFTTRTHALDAGTSFIARIRKAIADYRLYAETVDELRQLSDRDLADLGLHRASIGAVARESVYGA